MYCDFSRDSLERTLITLQRGLAAHQGRWAFYLLKYDHEVIRQRISAAVRQNYKNPHELHIDEAQFPNWLDLENHLGGLSADIDLIETIGLETWLTPKRAHHGNARRPNFAGALHCPLLAWLTTDPLAMLATEAVDLWDWRSGVFDFTEREEGHAEPLMNSVGQEPDLSALMDKNFTSTWGDKKRLCCLEGQTAYREELSLDDNPYIEGTWPHKWWAQSFTECSIG